VRKRPYFAIAFLAAGTVLPGALFGQVAQSGRGSTSLRGSFDPLATPVPARIPETVGGPILTVPRLPVIPPDQYDKVKSVPPRLPSGVAPGTTWYSPSGETVKVPARLPVELTPTLSFEGIQQTNYTPPSPNIAVGPDDILQVVNATIARYDRTGRQTSQINIPQWFAGTIFQTVCANPASCIFGDVNIRYDQMHGRFLMVLEALDLNAQTSYLLVSVSKGATYASGWTNWATNGRLDGDAVTANWADFPQVGIDNVAVYVTTNQFGLSDFLFKYAKVRIFRKTELYNPATVTLPYQDLFNMKNEDGTPAASLQVPQLRGRTQVGSGAGVMINASDNTNATYYTLWRINNPASISPSLTRSTLGGVWPYSYPAKAPQLGTSATLDTGPSSFGPAYMREGLLYGAQNVGYADEPTTVAYTVVDVEKKKITLQQRWVNGNFFYPAFDVPASIGPGTTLPSNLIVGTTTSPTGALTYPGLSNLKDGEDFYMTGGGTSRWGDFFGGAVDPMNGGLWVSGEYAKPRVNFTARWGTWNAYFPWSTTPEFTDVSPTANYGYNYINILKLWNVTRGCSTEPAKFCPADAVSRASLGVFIIRAIYGDTFAYPSAPYFNDVPATDPNFPYIQKMRELGITSGCSTAPALFCPDDPIKRWQAATFIVRAKLGGLFGDTFTYPTTAYFDDVPSGAEGFSFIQKFRELGYTNGCSATSFCPDATLTREMISVFLVRSFLN
jgi:hypothetical protein